MKKVILYMVVGLILCGGAYFVRDIGILCLLIGTIWGSIGILILQMDE